MDQNQLRTLLNGILGPHGLNIAAMNTNLQNAITAIPASGPRELSLVKVVDFYGKDSEDSHEWLNQDSRLLNIAKGYLRELQKIELR